MISTQKLVQSTVTVGVLPTILKLISMSLTGRYKTELVALSRTSGFNCGVSISMGSIRQFLRFP